jgi:hypothetical protein
MSQQAGKFRVAFPVYFHLIFKFKLRKITAFSSRRCKSEVIEKQFADTGQSLQEKCLTEDCLKFSN